MPPRTRGRGAMHPDREESSSHAERRTKAIHDDSLFRSREARDLFQNVFSKRNIISGRCILDCDLYRSHGYLEVFEGQGWVPLLTMNHPIYPTLVQAFFANITLEEGRSRVTSYIRGREIILDPHVLSHILGIPHHGSTAPNTKQWNVHPFSAGQQIQTVLDDPTCTSSSKPSSAQRLPVHHRIMHHILTHNIIPRDGHRDVVTYTDMCVLTHLILHVPFDLPHLMIWQIIDAFRKRTSLPYGLVFTRIFEHFGIRLASTEIKRLRDPHDFYSESTFRRMRLRLTHGSYVRREEVPEGASGSDSGSSGSHPLSEGDPQAAAAPATETAPPTATAGPSTTSSENDERLHLLHQRIETVAQSVDDLRLHVDRQYQDLTQSVSQQFGEVMQYLRDHLP